MSHESESVQGTEAGRVVSVRDPAWRPGHGLTSHAQIRETCRAVWAAIPRDVLKIVLVLVGSYGIVAVMIMVPPTLLALPPSSRCHWLPSRKCPSPRPS